MTGVELCWVCHSEVRLPPIPETVVRICNCGRVVRMATSGDDVTCTCGLIWWADGPNARTAFPNTVEKGF